MKPEFCASMMCADFSYLEREVKILDASGIDVFHIDIMDGRFVDNFGVGYQDMKVIRRCTDKPLEAHLMVKNPWNYLDVLKRVGVNIVYIHPEADLDPATTLERIRKMGFIPGIAINPGTSIASVDCLFYWVDRVLALCVNPGHAGRQYVPYASKKVRQLLELGREYDFDVIWDGSCTMEKIEKYVPLGVKGFVLGTSVLFGKNESYGEIMTDLKQRVRALVSADGGAQS